MKIKIVLLLLLVSSTLLNAQIDPVDLNDIISLMNPNSSLEAPRDFLLGGVIANGETFNGNVTVGNFGTPITAAGVHGPVMIDGETLRYGPVNDPEGSGRPVIQYAVQWIDNTGYQYQPGPNNTSTAPGNDPLFFDGSRVQTDHTNNRISLRDVTWQAFSVRMDDWIFAQDNKLHNQYHAPYNLGVGLSPYLAWYIDDGQLTISVRHSLNTTPTNSNSTSLAIYTETLTSTTVGQWQDWIVHMKQSPYPNESPFVHIWRRKQGGNWESIVQYNGPVGWDFSGYNVPGANDDNYLASSYYQWHNYNPTDLTYKVRRLWWKWNMLLRDNTNKYTLNDIQSHLDVNTAPLTGPTDLIPSDLVLMPTTNGSIAASLSAIDPNSNQFSYSLVPGIGDTDNNLFQISGDHLIINGNVTAARTYNVRLSVSNGNQITYEEAFKFHTPLVSSPLTITNVTEGGPGTTDPATFPSNVADGDLMTRWSRDGLGAFLTLELATAKSIDHVQMAFHKGAVRTADFEIQTSLDGISFITVDSLRRSTGQTIGYTYFGIGGTLAKYVRIIGQGNSVNFWNSFTEIELYGEDALPDPKLWVLLEGPLVDATLSGYLSEMSSELSEVRKLLPGMSSNPLSGQPFNMAPWNYNGTEGIGFTDATYQSLKNQNGGVPIADWILVELRTGLGANTVVLTQAGLLQADGHIIFTDPLAFSGLDGQFYIYISHRNHMGIISATPVTVVNGTFSHDFSVQNGNTDVGFSQKEITQGRWAMYVGDCNQSVDGPYFDINANDKVFLIQENGSFGAYLRSDFNLNGDVNGSEIVIFNFNNGIFSQLER